MMEFVWAMWARGCRRFSVGILALGLLLVAAPGSRAAEHPRVYVSSEDSGEISAVDPVAGEVLQHVSVGKRPRGIKLSPAGDLLYVALSGSPSAGPGVDESKLPPPDRSADGIGVIDLKSFKLLRTLPGGQDPEAFDISPDGKTLYISNEETAEVTVLDVTTRKVVQRVAVGREPEGVTVRPDGKVVYVTCEGDGDVVAIDTATRKVLAHIPTEARPRSVVFTKDGSTAFATAERGAAVTVIDARHHRRIATISIPAEEGKQLPARPMGSVLSADGKQVYISNGRGESVAVIDVATRKFVRSIPDVGTRPWGIGVSLDGSEVYTANGPSEDLSVISVASGKVERRIKVGGRPWGLVVGKP